ncbi:unnamed protein product [Vicia faba]|uniref:DUF4283 domain-containing protein n=1 Tax=Vicia faba TaxID=3906 RepID=A0AAV0ZL06_VICFA|nr:unnamed protein product [Vicia faba]
MVMGNDQDEQEEVEVVEEEKDDTDMHELEGMKVVEETIEEYECPTFTLTETEKKRIYRPWKRCVIMKLLGIKIGYKALESRLKQMWVRKVKKWRLNFEPSSDIIDEVTVWVRVSELPIEFYYARVLSGVGN